jgi:hypothetical protein
MARNHRAVIVSLLIFTAACLAGHGATTLHNISVSPASATVMAGKTQQFKAAGSGSTAIRWMVDGIAGGNDSVGKISASGLYTAPGTTAHDGVTITVAGPSGTPVLAKASISILENPELVEAHEQWLAGASEAAASFGCDEVAVQQQEREALADAVKLFTLTATGKKACLVLSPISTDPASRRYSFAWGGQVDGIDVYYISDVGQMRIWQGTPASGE